MQPPASEGSAGGNRPFTAAADLERVQVAFLGLRSQLLELAVGIATAKGCNSYAEVKLAEANIALEDSKISIEDAETKLGSIKDTLQCIGDDLGFDEHAKDLKSSTSSIFAQFPRSTAFEKNPSRQYFDSLPDSRVKSMEAEELEQYAAGWAHPSPTMDELAAKYPELYERIPDVADPEEPSFDAAEAPWKLLTLDEPQPASLLSIRGGPRPSRAGDSDGDEVESPGPTSAPKRLHGSRVVPPKPKHTGIAPSSVHANQNPRGSVGRFGVRRFAGAPWSGASSSANVGQVGGKGRPTSTLGKSPKKATTNR
jgi:hypothetical protein